MSHCFIVLSFIVSSSHRLFVHHRSIQSHPNIIYISPLILARISGTTSNINSPALFSTFPLCCDCGYGCGWDCDCDYCSRWILFPSLPPFLSHDCHLAILYLSAERREHFYIFYFCTSYKNEALFIASMNWMVIRERSLISWILDIDLRDSTHDSPHPNELNSSISFGLLGISFSICSRDLRLAVPSSN